MQYFLETSETVVDGIGFSHYDALHLGWLAALVVILLLNCLLYRKLGQKGRDTWKKAVAILLVLDEVFKHAMLLVGGNFAVSYLPLHLCSINIFLIAFHAWKPSKLLDNFLYMVCIPGTAAALLFPTWTGLPLMNFMHLHSFTVHILLMLYPLVLAVCGELKLSARMIPKCLGLLVVMAAVIYGVNLLLDTNFMFLMSADPGNPLYWFGQNWGSHLLGFPVIIVGVLIVMYGPLTLARKLKR